MTAKFENFFGSLEFSINFRKVSKFQEIISKAPRGMDKNLWCTFQILEGCQGRRTGVGVTTVSNSLILGGWVTKVLKNGDKKYGGGRVIFRLFVLLY